MNRPIAYFTGLQGDMRLGHLDIQHRKGITEYYGVRSMEYYKMKHLSVLSI